MGGMIVSPDDLRFTQDSIKNRFRPPYHTLRIDDAVDHIRKRLLSPNDFPALNVVQNGGILWSLDNRRLWVFRKAGVTVIKVNLVSLNYSPRSAGFFRDLERSLERRYSSPSYYPRVRGYIGCIPLESPAYLRDEAAAPNLAGEDTDKFSEVESVGVSESNGIFIANRPLDGAAQNLKADIEGHVDGREAFAECGGSIDWKLVQLRFAIVGVLWGVLRFLCKFM